MACGHILRSRLRDCGNGEKCKGEHWKSAFIDDSCAACHRPMLLRQNKARHEAGQSLLMNDYRQAKATGDEEGMCRLQRAMIEHTRLSHRRNFAVSLIREEQFGGVKWPKASEGDGCDTIDNASGESESESKAE